MIAIAVLAVGGFVSSLVVLALWQVSQLEEGRAQAEDATSSPFPVVVDEARTRQRRAG